MLKRISLNVFAAFFLLSCASNDITTRQINTFDYLQAGTTLKDFIQTYGPPFSVQDGNEEVLLVHYSMVGKTSTATFIPIVNLVATGNTYAIKRDVLKFTKQGRFMSVVDSNQVRGFASVYQMAPNEGFSGKGGVRSEQYYREVGRFLADKNIFFDQELWKGQNIANNYFQKFR